MSNGRRVSSGAAWSGCWALAWTIGCADASLERTPSDIAFLQERSEQRCAMYEQADNLMCRADARASHARRIGDSESIRCYGERGLEMRASWRRLEESRKVLRASEPISPQAQLEQARASVAEQSIQRIFASLDQCEVRVEVARVQVDPGQPYPQQPYQQPYPQQPYPQQPSTKLP